MRNSRPTSAFTSSNVRGVLTVDGTIRGLSTISSVEGIKVGGDIVVDGSATIAGIINGSISGNADTVTNPNLTGEVTTSGLNATVANSAVIGKVLTGYVSGAGTVAATDTILQAIQKLNGNAGGAAAAGTLTGTTLASNVLASSLTSVGTLANLTVTNAIAGSVTGNSAGSELKGWFLS